MRSDFSEMEPCYEELLVIILILTLFKKKAREHHLRLLHGNSER